PLWVLLLTVLAFLGLGVLVLGLMLWRRPVALALLTRLTAPLPGGVRQHLEPFLVRFVDALLALAVRPRLLLIAAAWTAVAVGLDALFCWLGGRGLGVRQPLALAHSPGDRRQATGDRGRAPGGEGVTGP